MSEAHDALICIGEKQFVDDKNRFRYNNSHFLKKNEEIKEIFKDLPEALENNFNFPLRFSYKPKKSKPILPSMFSDMKTTAENELMSQAQKGLDERLKNFIYKNYKNKSKNEIKKIYEDRLFHELKIINSMDYSSYFLIVSDYIRWAKKNLIPLGLEGVQELVHWSPTV